jgi:hypothetical protein
LRRAIPICWPAIRAPTRRSSPVPGGCAAASGCSGIGGGAAPPPAYMAAKSGSALRCRQRRYESGRAGRPGGAIASAAGDGSWRIVICRAAPAQCDHLGGREAAGALELGSDGSVCSRRSSEPAAGTAVGASRCVALIGSWEREALRDHDFVDAPPQQDPPRTGSGLPHAPGGFGPGREGKRSYGE